LNLLPNNEKSVNVFTVDLEDWYYSREHEKSFEKGDYLHYRQFLRQNTHKILNLLDDYNIAATFFVLGKLAENEKELLEIIVNSGHEIACHGYDHVNIDAMTPDEFRQDLSKSIKAIESATGKIPIGYRAPNFSIVKNNEWAYNVLNEFGFVYDSSVLPSGIGKIPAKPFVHSSGIIEIPISCAKISITSIPCGGGGYFRHYPYPLFRSLFGKSNLQNGSSVFYIHPWELNESADSIEAKGLKKYRKYHNSDKVHSRLEKLMTDFQFSPMSELINKLS
jgi:polysaccharide deacetylase family protein (PEP-CTERM system associated)